MTSFGFWGTAVGVILAIFAVLAIRLIYPRLKHDRGKLDPQREFLNDKLPGDAGGHQGSFNQPSDLSSSERGGQSR